MPTSQPHNNSHHRDHQRPSAPPLSPALDSNPYDRRRLNRLHRDEDILNRLASEGLAEDIEFTDRAAADVVASPKDGRRRG